MKSDATEENSLLFRFFMDKTAVFQLCICTLGLSLFREFICAVGKLWGYSSGAPFFGDGVRLLWRGIECFSRVVAAKQRSGPGVKIADVLSALL